MATPKTTPPPMTHKYLDQHRDSEGEWYNADSFNEACYYGATDEMGKPMGHATIAVYRLVFIQHVIVSNVVDTTEYIDKEPEDVPTT